MEFKKEIIIERSIEVVWEVLGRQYGEAYKWARGLKHSNGYGQPVFTGATCHNRTCETTQGKIKEVIKTFDPDNYVLVYEVIEGFPFFVKLGQNHWQLTKQNNFTKVNMHLSIQTQGWIGRLMAPLMKAHLAKVVDHVLVDLKHYVETGQPSPGKSKEMQKFKLKVA